MTIKFSFVLMFSTLLSLTSCSQKKPALETEKAPPIVQKEVTVKAEPHQYGGWYCPDNLFGFPPVNIKNWENVPVVNGRLPTREEVQSEASLIHIDTEKYPNAKALDITMPKLASVYNTYSKRNDLIIVIQAVQVNNDSIVGYRFLNGGNGSAWLSEVTFLSDEEAKTFPESKFVTHSIMINTTQERIWNVLTRPEYTNQFQPILNKQSNLKTDWKKHTNVNFKYTNSGQVTSSYGDVLFGNYYIQNDYDNALYSEKFFLSTNKETNATELKIVCGPYTKDFEAQKNILTLWANKVKTLSE